MVCTRGRIHGGLPEKKLETFNRDRKGYEMNISISKPGIIMLKNVNENCKRNLWIDLKSIVNYVGKMVLKPMF